MMITFPLGVGKGLVSVGVAESPNGETVAVFTAGP